MAQSRIKQEEFASMVAAMRNPEAGQGITKGVEGFVAGKGLAEHTADRELARTQAGLDIESKKQEIAARVQALKDKVSQKEAAVSVARGVTGEGPAASPEAEQMGQLAGAAPEAFLGAKMKASDSLRAAPDRLDPSVEAKNKADADLAKAQADFYGRRYSGPPAGASSEHLPAEVQAWNIAMDNATKAAQAANPNGELIDPDYATKLQAAARQEYDVILQKFRAQELHGGAPAAGAPVADPNVAKLGAQYPHGAAHDMQAADGSKYTWNGSAWMKK